ncbi:GNAT family N-acetyltransferase [Palleronia sediminis]|uniref:GNAT family N-acetyltransferase n=1 Tax=Palleronia sediminis TaxID=2547833 RepID=A0A4R6A9R4_9RHOB|nr:GNAT family N-acetyltransferase [Palleronia sediminis]TDL79572.1 GNAT family N-acetyltransferase [Palleronia sediminis]
MSAKLRIAGPADAERVLRLVQACHDEMGLAPDPARRDRAVADLLGGEMPGALYLIGPPASPVGYLALSFGHSLSAGGTGATLEEIYLRPPVRGRGMARDALTALATMLRANGVHSLHAASTDPLPSLFRRLRFAPAARPALYTLKL